MLSQALTNQTDHQAWKERLELVAYPGAKKASPELVSKIFFGHEQERQKFLRWVATALQKSYFPKSPISSWTQERLSTLFTSLFSFASAEELIGFIDGRLLKASQVKIWKMIIFELHVIQTVEKFKTRTESTDNGTCEEDANLELLLNEAGRVINAVNCQNDVNNLLEEQNTL